MSVNTEILHDQADTLEILRQQDAVTAIDFATDNVKLWAQYLDEQLSPVEPLHAPIVSEILANESLQRGAFFKGYHGDVRFPVTTSMPGHERVGEIFTAADTRGLFKHSDQEHTIKFHLLNEAIHEVPENAHEVAPDELLTFTAVVMAAHRVYQFLDIKINKGFKSAIVEDNNFRVAPGKEEIFWVNKLIGSATNPGIAKVSGGLSRMFETIRRFAEKEYGDEADAYMNAWWACLNLIKVEGASTRQLMMPILKPLLEKDLGAAEFAIKEQLHADHRVLPYRSRAKFALESEETEFFHQLDAEKEAELSLSKDQGRTAEELYDDSIRIAHEHVGSLVLLVTNKDEMKFAVVRRFIAIRPYRSEQLAWQAERRGQLALRAVQYGVKIDYCRELENGKLSTVTHSTGREVFADSLRRKVEDGTIVLLDKDEKYLDPEQKVFEIPAGY